MKQIALSIEQMNHLKELGVDTSDASLCWIKEPNADNYSLSVHDEACYEMSCLHPVPAYTLQDILEKIPENIFDNEVYRFVICAHDCMMYKGMCNYAYLAQGDSYLENAYDVLIWLLKKNIKI